MPGSRAPVPRIDQALVASVRALLDRRNILPTNSARPMPKVTARDGGGAELLIYDEISHWGISAASVADALDGVKGDLHVRVNSPGGDVFDGIAIYNMLADYPDPVTVTVDGLAASAASFISMAADRVVMNRSSQLMIHDASGLCYGNAADMAEMGTLLDRISDAIAGIYAARVGDAGDWRERMRAETWYSADEAVSAGLADEVLTSDRDKTPANTWDLSIFNYSGRDKAPAPVIAPAVEPEQAPEAPQPPQFDAEAFVAAMKGAFNR